MYSPRCNSITKKITSNIQIYNMKERIDYIMLNLSDVSPMLPVSNDEALTLLTVDDAAEMLMVGKNRVYELLNHGKIKGMRIGKSTWRIPKLSIYQFIKEQSSL